MASIDPKYSIGIEEMDAQHARWIALIEAFREAASGQIGDGAGLEVAEHALHEMLEYTRNHFSSEERFMARHDYPELAAHQQRHRELVAEVKRLLDEIQVHKSRSAPIKLNLFVTVWLFEHIIGEDIKYARHVLGRSAPADTRNDRGTV